ncbi:MAG TPA: hypothetical protein DCM64_06425 [Gammaproteobacteria bacterium]|nr:hypothetical protein [Gammaproteobacteria bacterium]
MDVITTNILAVNVSYSAFSEEPEHKIVGRNQLFPTRGDLLPACQSEQPRGY